MTTLSASEARERLDALVEEVREKRQPVQIVGRTSSAVLVSEEQWRAIQNTLQLASIHGVGEPVREEPTLRADRCDEDLGW